MVYEFRRGAAPETILRSFPAIGSLERVYGAITFYLANKQEVDQYLERQEELWENRALKTRFRPDSRRGLSKLARRWPNEKGEAQVSTGREPSL